MPVIADVFLLSGTPIAGATINAYKASRFGGIPAINAVPPGAADAGPVTTGTTYGATGNFQITVPTSEPYYISATWNGQTYWQYYDEARLDPSGVVPYTGSVPLMGAKLLAFGHSYMTGGGTTHADRQYITELTGLLRCDLIDKAVGGSEAANDQNWLGSTGGGGGWAWCLQNVVPSRIGAPYGPNGFLPIVHFGQNDVQQHSHDANGFARNAWKHAMRTIMSRLSASKVFENGDASIVLGGTGGTWQPVVADTTKCSGNDYQPVPGNGATVTWTIPADFAGGSVALGFILWPASDGQIAFTGTASALPSTISCANQAYSNNGSGLQRNSSLGVVARATGLVAADAGKTIIATYSGGAGTTLASPSAPAVSTVSPGVGGSYQYQLLWLHYNGETIPSSSSTAVTNGTTLTSSSYNSITIPAFPAGVTAARLLRVTATGGTGNSGQLGFLNSLVAGTGSVSPVTGLITAAGTVFDQGSPAASYTNRTLNPLVGGAALDYVQIEASNPPTRGLVMGLNRLPSGYINGTTDADITNYNTDLQALITEFSSNWLYVDVDGQALQDNSAYFSTTLATHPSDLGHARIAAATLSAMAAWPVWQLSDNAYQSRVSKRITSRGLIVLKGGIAYPSGTTIAADYTLPASFAILDTTNLAIPIDAWPGDDIFVELWGMVNNVGQAVILDACTMSAGGTIINAFSAPTGAGAVPGVDGEPSWFVPGANANLAPVTGCAIYTVTLADIITLNSVPGVVWVGIGGSSASGGRTLYGGKLGSPKLVMQVRNLGQRNTPGFNAS